MRAHGEYNYHFGIGLCCL